MVKKICLDSDIFIDLLNNNKDTLDKLNSLDADFYTTSINVFEIWMGKKNKDTISDLVSTLKIIDFTKESGLISANIKNKLQDKGQDLDIRDIFIGSICINEEIELMTKNTKHFERMNPFGLKLS
jgi:predicted nucleic acid-binding protein